MNIYEAYRKIMDDKVFEPLLDMRIASEERQLQYLDLFDVLYDQYTQAYRIDVRHSLYYEGVEHVLHGQNATKLLFNSIIKDIGGNIQHGKGRHDIIEYIKNCICECLLTYEQRGIIVRFGDSWIIDSGWVLTRILVPSP